MRPAFSSATLVLSTLFLAACAAAPSNTGKVTPPVAFKLHPGLLGLPVPPELQPVATAGASNSAMQMDPEGLRTQRSIYFDFNNADIRADFNPMLNAHGRYLAEHPESHVRVEGNADERGAPHYNRVLGMRRAHAVKNALLAGGAADKQIKTITLGDTRPKLKGKDEESWAENRRADVVYEVEK